MINFDPNVSSVASKTLQEALKPDNNAQQPGGFSGTVKALEKYLSNVDQLQQSSDMSIQDLLGGTKRRYCVGRSRSGKSGHKFQGPCRRAEQAD